MSFDQTELAAEVGLSDVELCFQAVLDKGSKDMVPADWETLGKEVSSALALGVDGIVVLHGTDTLHYTASALSFLLPDPGVPVVLTGSMIPGGDPESDSVANFRDAVTVAAYGDIGEVCVVFSADRPRTSGVILRGNRARKVHSQHIDAFASVNLEPLGQIAEGRISLAAIARPRSVARPAQTSTGFEPNVALVVLTPSVTPEFLLHTLDLTAGAVLAGTGIGHLHEDLHQAIEKYARPVVITTQVPLGGEALGLYQEDQVTLALANVVPGGSTSAEAALVKLMWALRQPEDVYALLRADIAGERSRAPGELWRHSE